MQDPAETSRSTGAPQLRRRSEQASERGDMQCRRPMRGCGSLLELSSRCGTFFVTPLTESYCWPDAISAVGSQLEACGLPAPGCQLIPRRALYSRWVGARHDLRCRCRPQEKGRAQKQYTLPVKPRDRRVTGAESGGFAVRQTLSVRALPSQNRRARMPTDGLTRAPQKRL